MTSESAEFVDYGWTTGGDRDLVHVRKIDAGSTSEVHELRGIGTSLVFARKIIRVFGSEMKLRDIQNELRAVDKLCKLGAHANIVSVFRRGKFSASDYYYLDMELCDLDLGKYLKRDQWTEPMLEKFPFFSGELSPDMRMSQEWEIMDNITSGVVFIHTNQAIHRDLKPRNVLYSLRDRTWKITDFGLTVEGATSVAQTTHYGRGTSGYRAPELIDENTSKNRYTNRVDIFALGCIFFELVFRRKAFESDFQVLLYAQNPRDRLMIPTTSGVCPDTRLLKSVSQTIHRMIHVDPAERPSAADLQKNFRNSLSESPSTTAPRVKMQRDHAPAILEDSIPYFHSSMDDILVFHDFPDSNLSTDNVIDGPLRGESRDGVLRATMEFAVTAWQGNLSRRSLPNTNDILSSEDGLVKVYTEHNKAIQECREAIIKEPKNFWLWKNVVKWLAIIDIESALRECKEAMEKHGYLSPSIMAVILYAAKGNYIKAIEVMTNMTTDKMFGRKLREALRPSSEIEPTLASPSREEKESLQEIQDELERNPISFKTWLSRTCLLGTSEIQNDLRQAAWRGACDVVRSIGWSGEDLKLVTEDRITALHLAVFNMHLETAKELLASSTPVIWLLAQRLSLSPLHIAADNNDTEMIKTLLAAGADLDASSLHLKPGSTPLKFAIAGKRREAERVLREAGALSEHNYRRWSPLHWAAVEGDGDVIRALAQIRFDNSYKDEAENDQMPLHLAVLAGKVENCRALWETGANTSAQDSYWRTPLHLAVAEEKIEIVKLLVEFGVDMEIKDANGKTPMAIAVYTKRSGALVKELTKGRATVDLRDDRGQTPVHIAIAYKDVEMLQALKDAGVSIGLRDKSGRSPVHLAVENSDYDAIRLLKPSGADASLQDHQGQTPLHIAVEKGDLGLVRLLGEFNANPSVKNSELRTPLHIAIERKYADISTALLDIGASLSISDGDGRNALQLAVYRGYVGFVKKLIAAGADLSVKDESGKCPIHIAAAQGFEEVVNVLLAAGADLNSTDNEGRTPLHLAASEGHAEIIKVFTEAGANLSPRDREGKTPVHLAANKGEKCHCVVIRTLKTAGADVSICDHNKSTPLHGAAKYGKVESVKTLLEAGCDASIKNVQGCTAMGVAELYYRTDIKRLLSRAGTKKS